MFPFAQLNAPDPLPNDHQPNRPPSRLDVQRQHLEHQKMYHLNTMVVDQSQSSIDRQIVNRQQILEATANELSLSERLRQRIASVLISAGQRIEPDACPRESRLNA